MTTYVAVTSTNPQNGWREVTTGTDKTAVRDAAEQNIAGHQWNQVKDIYTQTELTNLRVVSKTTAKRDFGVDIDAVDIAAGLRRVRKGCGEGVRKMTRQRAGEFQQETDR
jgi:hypothetical protein